MHAGCILLYMLTQHSVSLQFHILVTCQSDRVRDPAPQLPSSWVAFSCFYVPSLPRKMTENSGGGFLLMPTVGYYSSAKSFCNQINSSEYISIGYCSSFLLCSYMYGAIPATCSRTARRTTPTYKLAAHCARRAL